MKCHFFYGTIATCVTFFGFYIELSKMLVYNACGGTRTMGKYERDRLSLDNQIVKSNKMIQGKYKMSALEQKLVLTLCSKITSNDDMFTEFSMTVNEFANFLDIDNKDYSFNRTLKRKCKILNNKDIEMNLRNERKPRLAIFSLV